MDLSTQLQLIDQFTVLVAIDRTQVIQKPPAAADELQESLTRAEILSMSLEMARELVDSFRNERNLHSWTACVGGMLFEALDRCLFNFFR